MQINRIIIQVNHLYPAIGSTMRVLSYAQGFIANGYKVVLVTTLTDSYKPEIRGLQIINVANNESGQVNRWLRDYRFYKTIKQIARKGDVVLYYSSPLFQSFMKGDFVSIVDETEVPLYGLKAGFIHRFFSWCRDRVRLKADALFVISHTLKEYFCEKGFPKEKIFVATMMVDSSRFEGVSKDSNEDYVAYCGSISNHKDGVDTLIKSFAKVHKKLPTVRLLMAGNFTTEEDKRLDYGLIKDLHLEGVVEFVGSIPSNDLPQFLINAHCLVLSRPNNTQAYYGFPNKVGEYLLTGNPIVITSVGDLPLYLRDGEECYIAKCDDIDSISDKLIEALTSPLAKTVGQQGCEKAKQVFNNITICRDALRFVTNISR